VFVGGDMVNEVVSSSVAGGRAGGMMWMRFAGILGIVFLVLGIAGFVMSFFTMPKISGSVAVWSVIIISFVLFVLFEFYLFGFFKMGQKANSKMLRVSSLIYIISLIAFLLIAVLSVFYLIDFVETGPASLIGSPNFGPSGMPSLFTWQVVFILGLLGFWFLVRGLFSLSLLFVRLKVKFSLAAATLGIIFTLVLFGTWGYVIYLLANPIKIIMMLVELLFNPGALSFYVWLFRGVFVLGLVVLLFETLSLFNASKKFES
jgi:hypothetical protein